MSKGPKAEEKEGVCLCRSMCRRVRPPAGERVDSPLPTQRSKGKRAADASRHTAPVEGLDFSSWEVVLLLSLHYCRALLVVTSHLSFVLALVKMIAGASRGNFAGRRVVDK